MFIDKTILAIFGLLLVVDVIWAARQAILYRRLLDDD